MYHLYGTIKHMYISSCSSLVVSMFGLSVTEQTFWLCFERMSNDQVIDYRLFAFSVTTASFLGI